MLKKTLKILVVLVGILFFSQKAYANVDIELRDNKELQEVSVIVNSNDAELVGVDLPIVFSKNVRILEITKTDYCSFMFNNYTKGEKIFVECFNDPQVVMNGEVVKIKYDTSANDYYFYVDSGSVDTGGETLGEIVDINKPMKVPNVSKVENGKDSNNLFLIISIIVAALSLAFLAVIVVKRKKETPVA